MMMIMMMMMMMMMMIIIIPMSKVHVHMCIKLTHTCKSQQDSSYNVKPETSLQSNLYYETIISIIIHTHTLFHPHMGGLMLHIYNSCKSELTT